MAKTIKQRMLDLLKETAEHYNANNRCITSSTACAYIPDHPDESEGCAIGRKLPKYSKELVIKKNLNTVGVVDLVDKGVPLGRVFKDIPLGFLEDLHDTNYYWNEHGLTGVGIHRLNHLEKRVAEGEYE